MSVNSLRFEAIFQSDVNCIHLQTIKEEQKDTLIFLWTLIYVQSTFMGLVVNRGYMCFKDKN